MSKASDTAVEVLTNRKVLAGIAVVIIVYVLYKNGPRWWAQITRRDVGDTHGGPINDVRESELKALAEDAYRVIYGTPIIDGFTWSDRDAVFAQLLPINDGELRWAALYYENQLAEGISLRTDLSGEWYVGGVAEQLATRLSELNL